MEVPELLPPIVVLSLAAVLLVLPIASSLLNWRKRRAQFVRLVDEVPGPPSYPLIGSFGVFLGLKREELFAKFVEITKTYAPILRIWEGHQPTIHLTRAKDAEIILNSTTLIEKSTIYWHIRPFLGDGLILSKGSKWHTRRKMITPTFHFKILESFLSVFVEKSQILVDIIQTELNNTEGFDICPYIKMCALDIVCETAMGISVNAQRSTNSPYVKAIDEITGQMVWRSVRPWLYSDYIFFHTKEGKKFRENLATLKDFTNKVIQEKRETFKKRMSGIREDDNSEFGTKKRLAFLDLLLEANTFNSALTDDDIREEVDTFMFAGHDTTSTNISWVLYLLGAHPQIQENVTGELNAIFQGSNRPPNMHDLSEMKYLERVIKETLRLYPSVPVIGRHVKEDIKIGKYTIPAGADVAIQIFQVHRDPEFFPNPDKFDPDHFLPERVQGRHPYAFIPFSAGSRNCLGQKFAMLKEKVLLSSLLRNYSFKSLDREKDLKLLGDLVLRPAQGVRVCMKRSDNS